MPVTGIIVHHSVCPSINGKGYDYFIKKDGLIIPAANPTDPNFIHICLEGDFSKAELENQQQRIEQLFILQKLALRLADTLGFRPGDLFPHTETCPGEAFRWTELVILEQDRYH